MKFLFEIGNREKHVIVFQWSQFWGSLRVSVDGNPVDRKFMKLASQAGPAQGSTVTNDSTWVILGKEINLITRWDFTVGLEEKHRIRIEKKRPTWFAGLRPYNYRVFVDETEIINQTGY
jgi:hypothetical protein